MTTFVVFTQKIKKDGKKNKTYRSSTFQGIMNLDELITFKGLQNPKAVFVSYAKFI